MRTAIAAALAVAMGSAGAMAAQAPAAPMAGEIVTQVRTTADLAAVCDPAWAGVPRLEAIAYCQGFLTAAGQYHALMHPRGGRFAPIYCVPSPGPTIAETGVGFAAWARENPQWAGEPALDGFFRWAKSRFPCAPAPAAPRRR